MSLQLDGQVATAEASGLTGGQPAHAVAAQRLEEGSTGLYL